MAKTENDKTYEEGFKSGKNGDLLDDISQGISPTFTKSGEIWDKGYKEGAKHRNDDSSNDDSSNGGCYLTTACINSKGLSNNCLELNVLRRFRDSVLLPTSKGREAVKEYYKIAPEIILLVNKKEGKNAINVWNSLYEDVQKAVSLVMKKDFNKAFTHYKQMTSRLKENYFV